VHEGFHGIIARMHKMKLKSAGLILFGFLPIGAFVEPDEKKFEKEKPLKKLQVLSAGPASNLALFAIAFFIFAALSASLLTPYLLQEVKVAGVSEFLTINGKKILAPAFGKLHAGGIILELNGVKITGLEQLRAVSKDFNELDFKVRDINGLISLQKIAKTSAGTIGVFFEQPYSPSLPPLNSLLVEFFFWLFMLNFLVAVANFMPFWAFDGGKIVQIMLLPYFKFAKMHEKDTEKLIARIFLWIIGILLLVNALPLFQF
jgi:membrane-associated protease RseP (regulator of RpoE activity)